MTSPTHPINKSALIPVIITHPNGVQQTYWISLKKFMEEQEKGTKIKRIPQKEHKSVINPGKTAKTYEEEFIENFIQFDKAGIKVGNNEYTTELVSKVIVKKNGKKIDTLVVRIDKEKLARELLENLLGVQ